MDYSADKIFVSGHRGMVGSALVRALNERGASNILTCNRSDLDLTQAAQVEAY